MGAADGHDRCRSALTYYWGLTLSVQALVQPTLTEPFPDVEFFVFWGKHVLIVLGRGLPVPVACATAPTGSSYRTGGGVDARLAGGRSCA